MNAPALTVSDIAQRPRRADSQRNAAALVAAARELFVERGADVSLDEVARAAGVGKGTLYRNFSSRGRLLQAVLQERFEGLRVLAEIIVADVDAADDAATRAQLAGAGVASWLESFAEHAGTYRGLGQALAESLSDGDAPVDGECDRMCESFLSLLERGWDAGVVRRELSARSILVLVSAAIGVAGNDEPRAQATLRVILDGLAAVDGGAAAPAAR